MIISHKYKFIFIAIPKTGTHSIREAIRPILGKFDWEQCKLFVNKKIPVPEIATIGHGHFPQSVIADYLPKNMLNNYYSFCFVRNPYERFLSFCYFFNRNNNKMKEKPNETILAILNDKDLFDSNILLKPQNYFTHLNEIQVVDFIGRFENIEADFKHVLSSCHLDDTTTDLGITNVSTDKGKVRLTDEMKALVQNYYYQDFVKFNYKI